jgi:CSLREA domain-containing protein
MKKHGYRTQLWATSLCAGLLTLSTGCPDVDEDKPEIDRLLVTTLADEDNGDDVVSLREAVASAGELTGERTIRFQAGLAGEIALGAPIGIGGDATKTIVIEAEPDQALVVRAAEGQRVLQLDGAALILRGVELIGSRVADANGGGCILARKGSLTLERLRLSSCRSDAEGGAVRALEEVAVTLASVVFEGNQADRGGAVMARGTLNVSDATFTDNAAKGSGGAIYAAGVAVTVSAATFEANTADSGAGLFADHDQAQISVEKTAFTRNVASFRGGGFYLKHGGAMLGAATVLLRGTTFSKNADQSSGGGGVAITGVSSVTVEDCVFVENVSAGKGGGLDGEGELALTGSQFSQNTSLNAGGGVSFVGLVRARASSFEGNTAVDGGGLSLSASGAVTLEDLRIEGNAASRHGGGLVVGSTVALAPTIDGCTIAGNTAAGQGGGVYTSNDLTIAGSSIEGNQAESGGGIVTSAGSTLTLASGTVVTKNQATSSKAGEENLVGGGVDNDGDVVLAGGSVAGNTPDEFSSPDRVSAP